MLQYIFRFRYRFDEDQVRGIHPDKNPMIESHKPDSDSFWEVGMGRARAGTPLVVVPGAWRIYRLLLLPFLARIENCDGACIKIFLALERRAHTEARKGAQIYNNRVYLRVWVNAHYTNHSSSSLFQTSWLGMGGIEGPCG